MQSRGQLAIAAVQPVHTGMGSLWFVNVPERAPTGGIPQPGLGPVWLAPTAAPVEAAPEVAPLPTAPLLPPLPLATLVEPAPPMPLLVPEPPAALVEPVAGLPALAPDPAGVSTLPELAAFTPLPADPPPAPTSPPLVAPLPPTLLPVETLELEPPWGLPPHATATRSATQGIAREQDR